MLAYYVHDLSPYLVRFTDAIAIRWYGLAYVAAFFLGILVVKSLSRRGYCDIPEAKVADFIIGGAIFGVLLGGRLGYMLFYNWDGLIHDPISIVRVWDGGMSAHGGMIGLTLYTGWYSWRSKISWLNIGDSVVVAAPLGLFLGRLANFINGELYGRVTNVPWAIQFPKELYTAPQETVSLALQESTSINPAWNSVDAIIEASRNSEPLRSALAGILSPRHPSQFYEAFLEGALLFTVLWLLRTKVRLPNGVLTAIFFFGYALLRSISEFFREPDAPLTGSLTRGQFLSIFLVLIGLGFLVAAMIKPAYPRGRS